MIVRMQMQVTVSAGCGMALCPTQVCNGSRDQGRGNGKGGPLRIPRQRLRCQRNKSGSGRGARRELPHKATVPRRPGKACAWAAASQPAHPAAATAGRQGFHWRAWQRAGLPHPPQLLRRGGCRGSQLRRPQCGGLQLRRRGGCTQRRVACGKLEAVGTADLHDRAVWERSEWLQGDRADGGGCNVGKGCTIAQRAWRAPSHPR